MLNAARLLSVAAGAVRRQPWAFVPLFIARVLARLLGLTPMVVLTAHFIRTGMAAGASDSSAAWWLGLLDNLDDFRPWTVATVGGVLAAAGGWLIVIVIDAGVLRLLGAQAGRVEPAPDDTFAEGVLKTPATYLVAGAGAEVLKLLTVTCALGMLVTGMGIFSAHPGVAASLIMTLATGLILLSPFLAASLDLGFARAVILEEDPSVALGEGLMLAQQRAGALFPPWYVLAVADLVIVLGQGFALLIATALPAENGGWILQLVPVAIIALLGTAATTLVSLHRLGLYATTVAEAAGTLPVLPPLPQRIARAMAVAGPMIETGPAAPMVSLPADRGPGENGVV